MLSEPLEDSPSLFMMEGKVVLGVDAHVVHVDLEPLLCYHVSTYVVHECLEGRGSIGETKEHDSQFIKSRGVMKAAFHWSSSLRQILLYP